MPGLLESQHKDGQLNGQADTGISCPGEDGSVNIWKKYQFMRTQWSTWPNPLHREMSVLILPDFGQMRTEVRWDIRTPQGSTLWGSQAMRDFGKQVPWVCIKNRSWSRRRNAVGGIISGPWLKPPFPCPKPALHGMIDEAIPTVCFCHKESLFSHNPEAAISGTNKISQ